MNYVGIDYHKRYSVATVMDQNGVVLAQKSLANRRSAFQAFLQPFGEAKAVVEATRGWAIPVEILEQIVGEVHLANPYLVKAIARGRFGHDKIDSCTLAKLLQIGWLPEAYLRSKANREQQLILRIRCFFVGLRTQVKNRIHDLIDRQDEPIREAARQYSDLFGKRGRAWLNGLQLGHPHQPLLTKLLAAYDALNEQIKGSSNLVDDLFKSDPDCQLLSSIPGFGRFFAVLCKVEIGDIGRFPDSSRLCSYAGVVPWTESSGGKTWTGPLIKQSNRWLRWIFIEAAIPATVADKGLRSYYEHYRQSKGSKTARVIVGRRLCTIAYQVLRQHRLYYEQPPHVSTCLRAK